MKFPRLVVWITLPILGFQGNTLLLNLIHCIVISWLYLRTFHPHHMTDHPDGIKGVDQHPRTTQEPPKNRGVTACLMGSSHAHAPPTDAKPYNSSLDLAPWGACAISGASMQARRIVSCWPPWRTRRVSPCPTESTVAAMASVAKSKATPARSADAEGRSKDLTGFLFTHHSLRPRPLQKALWRTSKSPR